MEEIEIRWNIEKNEVIKDRFSIGFEDIVTAAQEGRIVFDSPHPNTVKYPHQRRLIIDIDNYAWIVPYVIDTDGYLFLKTMFPSRKATKEFIL